MNPSGRLDIVVGPPKSGKSTRAIREYIHYQGLGLQPIIIIAEHAFRADDQEYQALLNRYPSAILQVREHIPTATDNYKIIIVDEAQFYPSLLEAVTAWMKRKCTVKLYGLDCYINRVPALDINGLASYATTIKKVTGLCDICRQNDILGCPSICAILKQPLTQPVETGKPYIEIGRGFLTVCYEHSLTVDDVKVASD